MHQPAQRLDIQLPSNAHPIFAAKFAGRVLEVRRAYRLTVDRRESAELEQVLRGCASTAMEPVVCGAAATASGDSAPDAGDGVDALVRWDDNRNGRITCAEARRHGIASVRGDHPAHPYMRDDDGVVCE